MRIEDLRDEEQKYLAGAFQQTSGGPFDWKQASSAAGMPVDVARDAAQSLALKGLFVDKFLTSNTRLTPEAKLLAREIIERNRRAVPPTISVSGDGRTRTTILPVAPDDPALSGAKPVGEEILIPEADKPFRPPAPRHDTIEHVLPVTPPGTPKNGQPNALRLLILGLIVLLAIFFTPLLYGQSPLDLWNQGFFAQVIGTAFFADLSAIAMILLRGTRRPKARKALEITLWAVAILWICCTLFIWVRRWHENKGGKKVGSVPATTAGAGDPIKQPATRISSDFKNPMSIQAATRP